jgi:peptidoglycan/xylan/chitin deacetylase (PgdA/CDA1 family)
MFHSISKIDSKWSRNYLTVDWRHFERFCRYLKNRKVETVSLKEWYSIQNDLNSEAKKKIVLTFDDGYLDNWVFAYPILKKYGLKGSIFINPEFVDPSLEGRPNLENCNWDKTIIKSLKYSGFMNWAEIKQINDSGVLDVQSHSMSHNFYFKSSKVIDFYNGQGKYDWLAWIYRPERKPFYMTENQMDFISFGTPIFEFGRALGLKQFFPSDILIDFARVIYNRTKADLQVTDKFKQNYLRECNQFVNQNKNFGYFESNEEQEARFRYELLESKKILEAKLNKRIEFLCWPGGGYNDLSIKISKECGYIASTFASFDDKINIDNTGYYKRITREGLSSNIQTRKNIYPLPYINALIHVYKAKNNIFYKAVIKSLRLVYKIGDYFKVL